jgi:hypothetical protein
MNNNAVRQTGVLLPEGQTSNRSDLPELTVTGFLPAQFAFVKYIQNGRERQALLIKAGDGIYMDPDGESFASKLKTCSDKFAERVAPLFGNVVKPAADPSEPIPNDQVDVL